LHQPVYPELVEGLPFLVRRRKTAGRKGQPFDKLRVDGRVRVIQIFSTPL
jgi:hypothetical protein